MQYMLGTVFVVLATPLVIAQIISVLNFPLAQRFGLQEKPESADPLMRFLEYNTAIWDLVTVIWLPVAGLMMILDLTLWPVFALIGGAVYVDAGGREAAKNLGLQKAGIRTGSKREKFLFSLTYLIMILLGLSAILFASMSMDCFR